jgi:hypothetical protein
MEDFYFGNGHLRRKLSKEGKLIKLAMGVYTSIAEQEKLERALNLNWALIVKHLFPNAVLSYRTALEFRPSPQGYIFLSSAKEKVTKIGHISFKEIRVKLALSQTDTTGMMGAKTACKERAFLELCRSSRITPEDDRYLGKEVIDKKLEDILTLSGEETLNIFRDNARKISEELSLQEAFRRLNQTISSLLGSRSAEDQGQRVKNRNAIESVDKEREMLFETLFTSLIAETPPIIKETFLSNDHFSNKAFFESYFSNYIEGTEFLIEEAEEIIFLKKEDANRPEDSHDMSGTFEVANDKGFLKREYGSSDDFLRDLQYINKTIIPLRADKNPGQWKEKSNKAGSTIFVNPTDVKGTLRKGFDIAQRIEHPFLKGVFLSFVVSEVHPFNDGNGRTCRLILNRELVKSGSPTIIIPSVYRDDYMGVLKQASKRQLFSPLYRMFLRAWKFSHLDFSNYQKIKKEIVGKNWSSGPNDAKIIED